MELTELKQIKNGAIPVDKPSIQEKMNPAGALLETTTGKSTLTDRKAINNLPKYNLGKVNEWMDKKNSMFGTNAGAVTSSVGGAIDFVGGIASAGQFNTTADDALMDAGTSTGNIGGINYTRQNDVNAAQISAQTGAENTANTVGLMGKGASLGASVGSVAGPVGGLIGGAVGAIGGLVGGLFGGAARRRKMRQMIAEAKDKAFRQNDFSRSGALTSLLQQQYAQQYGDTESQSLYGFADGKAFSAAGPTDGYNARVSNGEIIANKYTGEMFRVPGLPNNKDGKLAYIRPSDTIITNKYGLSDYVAETGDLEGGEAMMSSIMKAKGKKGYKCGKLPKFAWGLPEWTNLGTNAIGMIGSMVDANKIENELISNPDTRKANPFVNVALNTMANIKYNNYQAYNDLWDTAYKYRNSVNNNGNLSAAQRAVMNYAGYKDAMDTMAKINQYAQEANNKYGQAFAQMAAQLGEDQANRDQKAAMFDYEAYNQAHGARRLMSSQRKADAMNYLNNWAKGLTDMHMWRDQMGLYQQDIDERRKDRYQRMGLDENGNKITSDPFTHVSPYNIRQNGGNPIYSSQNDKITAAANSMLSDNVYSSTQAEIQKQLAKQQKKALKNKTTSKKNIVNPTVSSTIGGRVLNPSALTSAIQRGAAIGRQETPYWHPTQISDMLNYIMQNKFFLR